MSVALRDLPLAAISGRGTLLGPGGERIVEGVFGEESVMMMMRSKTAL